MSSADILEALASIPPSEQEYLAQDPYFLGARQVYGMQLPQARNNTEAILGPVLQGLIGGTLQGYGRANATQTQYEDYRNNPIIKELMPKNVGPLASGDEYGKDLSLLDAYAYDTEAMPDGWTAKQGKSDLLLGALAKQETYETELKKAESRAKLDELFLRDGVARNPETGAYEQIPILAEAKANAARMEAAAKKQGEIEATQSAYGNDPVLGAIMGLPPGMQTKAIEEMKGQSSAKRAETQIDAMYDDAKKVGSVSAALNPFSSDAKKLQQMAVQIPLMINSITGREMNESIARRLPGLIPAASDTEKQIEEKRKAMKDIIKAISDPTGVLTVGNGSSAKGLALKPSPSSYSNFGDYKAALNAWKAETGG